MDEPNTAPDSQQETTPGTESARSARLVSLDALRGLTILLMLLVNNTAVDYSTPKQLMHAPWNGGVRVADLVFPWFLFCVGAAIPYSAASFRRRGLPWWRYGVKALWRAVALLALGCLIDSSIYKQPTFDLGVLQLIGLAYLVGALLYWLPLRFRILAAGVLLVGYWAAIKFIPVPGVGVGVFEEERNLIEHINRHYLSSLHLAGLMSVIPTAAMVLIGTAIGDLLRARDRSSYSSLSIMAFAGLGLIGVGVLWNLHLPYNKPVWTPSYILFTAGAGCLALALLYLIIDVCGWRWWSFPLVVFGSNAILAYVAPILVKLLILREWTVPAGSNSITLQQWCLQWWVERIGRIPGGWAYTASYILVWWVVLLVLYRKKIFLRV